MTKAIYTYIPSDGEGDEEARELKARNGQTVDVKSGHGFFFVEFPDGHNGLATKEELEFLPRHAAPTPATEGWFNPQHDCAVLRWRDVKIGDRITIFNNYKGTPEYGTHTFVVTHPDDIRPDDLRLELLSIEPGVAAISTEEWIEKRKPIDWKKRAEEAEAEVEKLKHLNANQAKTIALHQSAYSKLDNEVEQYKEALSWESTYLAERTNQFDKAVQKINELNEKLLEATETNEQQFSDGLRYGLKQAADIARETQNEFPREAARSRYEVLGRLDRVYRNRAYRAEL